jgi:hypothetical protein
MKTKEKLFKHRKITENKQALWSDFKHSQYSFDKEFRRLKRTYQRGQMLEVEILNTKNPNEFWKYIKNLGPRKKQTIPLEIVDNNGKTNNNPTAVLARWRDDFSSLYSVSIDHDVRLTNDVKNYVTNV